MTQHLHLTTANVTLATLSPMSPRQRHRQHDSAAPSSAWLDIYIALRPSRLGSTIASNTQQRHHVATCSSTSTIYDCSGKQTRCQLILILFTIIFGSRANASIPMRCWHLHEASTFWRLTSEDFKLYTPELNSSKNLIWESGATPNRCTYTVPLFDQLGKKALNNLMLEYLVPEIEYSANSS
jgi:hypothetical protein